MLIDSGTQVLLMPMPQSFQKLHCWYYWGAWLVVYAIAIISVGMIYIPRLTTIGSGIRVLLRLLPANLRSCNVGITDGRNLGTPLFRWLKVAWYTYQVSWRSLQEFK
jgi:hypothetical protein